MWNILNQTLIRYLLILIAFSLALFIVLIQERNIQYGRDIDSLRTVKSQLQSERGRLQLSKVSLYSEASIQNMGKQIGMIFPDETHGEILVRVPENDIPLLLEQEVQTQPRAEDALVDNKPESFLTAGEG